MMMMMMMMTTTTTTRIHSRAPRRRRIIRGLYQCLFLLFPLLVPLVVDGFSSISITTRRSSSSPSSNHRRTVAAFALELAPSSSRNEDETLPSLDSSTNTRTSSWIPRLSCVFACQVHSRLRTVPTTTMRTNELTRKIITFTNSSSTLLAMEKGAFSWAAAQAVANITSNTSAMGHPNLQAVLEGYSASDNAIHGVHFATQGNSEDDDPFSLASRSFFPRPMSSRDNKYTAASTPWTGSMWNLTEDLLVEEQDTIVANGCTLPMPDSIHINDRDGQAIEESSIEDFLLGFGKPGMGELPSTSGPLQETVIHDIDSLEVLLEEEDCRETPVTNDDDVEKQRRLAAQISHSFYAKKFQPAWFARNPHLQTVVAVKARQESMYFPTTGNLVISKFTWDHRERVETWDGDIFGVDWKYATEPVIDGSKLIEDGLYFLEPKSRTPVVLICHGLQSNTESPLIKDMAIAFNGVGMDVAAINFRGCGGETIRTPVGYHLSYTKDLEFYIKRINQRFPGRSIYLSGFSLGANVVTKFLADIGSMASGYNICGAAVNAVPFDLTKAQALNQPGFERKVYGNLMLKSLQDRILQSMDTVQYNFTKEELLDCKTCRDFDDLVICSVHDQFENATDYHRKSSTWDRLEQIMVPQYILQALDDPFFAGNTNPEDDPELPCRIQYSEHGGHCGFIFHTEERDKRLSSFMPTELARFVEHVHHVRTGQKPPTAALRTPNEEESDVNFLQCTEDSDASCRRAMAYAASQTFQPKKFVPARWARNEHFQTIMGALFRREAMYAKNQWDFLFSFLDGKTKIFEWDERQRMVTPDGDFFDVDWKYSQPSKDSAMSNFDAKPIVLICHGLQSDSSSPLAQDMAQAFIDVGMDSGCINFRGCSGEINKTPLGYHLGFTDDLKQMIDYINLEFDGKRRIYLSGFSLGANVVTNCLAELGDAAYERNVYGAAVNAVPFDMMKAHVNLNQEGLTKSLYGSRLLESMIDRLDSSYGKIGFYFPREELRKCRTIMDVENLAIAPVFGFKDAYDYYRKTSTLHKVDKVAVPQYVIQAKDDPFFRGLQNPIETVPGRPLRIQTTEFGGHCGYVFHEETSRQETSWMPTELARFLSHLESSFATEINS